MKKLIAILAVLMLVVSVIPAAFAAEAVTATVSGFQPTEDNYLVKGDKVTITVSLNKEFNGFGGIINYDNTVLKLTNIALSGASSNAFCQGNPNRGIFGVGSSQNEPATAVLVLTFEVLVDEGETTISLGSKANKPLNATHAIPAFDDDGNPVLNEYGEQINETVDYAISVVEGTVIIGKPVHKHTEETVKGYAATCTEDGLTDGIKCATCGEWIVKQEVIPALGHDEKIIPGKAATCTETGLTEGKECARCGVVLVKQEVIAALGHKFVEGTVPAYKCTDGYDRIDTCSVCGETKTVHVDGHDHEWNYADGAEVEIKEPTETEWGYVIRACKHAGTHGCDATLKQDLKPLGEPGKVGDITPYITMTVVTVVALVSLAAYGLKRKHI